MEILSAGTQLFDIFKQQKKWSHAVVLLEELVKLAEEGFGCNTPVTLLCMAQLATCLAAQGNLDQALTRHQQVVRALEESSVGPAHAATLDVLSNLASRYADSGLWEESEGLYTTVIQAATVSLGPEHQTTLVSQKNLEMVRKERAALTRSSSDAMPGK
jgi:lipopolysaccharide biosynthesis regulator YciM